MQGRVLLPARREGWTQLQTPVQLRCADNPGVGGHTRYVSHVAGAAGRLEQRLMLWLPQMCTPAYVGCG